MCGRNKRVEDGVRKNWLVAFGLVALCVAVLAGAVLLARPYLPASLGIVSGAKPGSDPGVFAVAADSKGIPGLLAPQGASMAPIVIDGGAAVRLSGVKSDAPSAGYPGIYVPTTASFELAASGKTVRVTVTARSASETPSPGFSVAYSTSDVGNSGWRNFPLTDKLTPYSFIYDVPTMKSGNGDYIGILPDPSGAGGAVEVSSITAEVVPPGTKP
jgi:hypothetical protein